MLIICGVHHWVLWGWLKFLYVTPFSSYPINLSSLSIEGCKRFKKRKRLRYLLTQNIILGFTTILWWLFFGPVEVVAFYWQGVEIVFFFVLKVWSLFVQWVFQWSIFSWGCLLAGDMADIQALGPNQHIYSLLTAKRKESFQYQRSERGSLFLPGSLSFSHVWISLPVRGL